MRSKIAWWTPERIMFYERASERTDFHLCLSRIIESEIEKTDGITELGAGLGRVTEILKNDGYDIVSYDSSRLAVEVANKRYGSTLITERDACSVRETRDVLLALFFGNIESSEDLDYFLSLARKKLIYIISRHRANPYSEKKDRKESIINILEKKGIKYRVNDYTLSFDQPLKDDADAEAFFLSSYGNTRIPILDKGDDEYPLIFKNNKEISMFIIEKERKT